MKSFTIFPLQSYRTKLAGSVITILSLALLAFEKATGLFISESLNAQKTIQIAILLTIVGLFMVVFSKEKIDDERVKKTRLKALQFGFSLVLALLISLIFVSIIHPTFSLSGTHDLSLICLISLIAYLLFFYIALYIDPKEIYNDDNVSSNVKKNRTFFLAYTLGLSLIVLLLIVI